MEYNRSTIYEPLRDDLPDVDIDFQHWQQGEVMNRIFKKWSGKTARLFNYVMFREKSARKEAAKRLGAKGNCQETLHTNRRC